MTLHVILCLLLLFMHRRTHTLDRGCMWMLNSDSVFFLKLAFLYGYFFFILSLSMTCVCIEIMPCSFFQTQ